MGGIRFYRDEKLPVEVARVVGVDRETAGPLRPALGIAGVERRRAADAFQRGHVPIVDPRAAQPPATHLARAPGAAQEAGSAG